MNKLVGLLLVVLPVAIVFVGYLVYAEIDSRTKVTLAAGPVVLPESFCNSHDDEFRALPEKFQRQFTEQALFEEYCHNAGFRERLEIAAEYGDTLTDLEFQSLISMHEKYETATQQVKAVLNVN